VKVSTPRQEVAGGTRKGLRCAPVAASRQREMSHAWSRRQLMAAVVARENMLLALKARGRATRVPQAWTAMPVEALRSYLRIHLAGRFRGGAAGRRVQAVAGAAGGDPQARRRDATVWASRRYSDRLIQQALHQVLLQPIFEPQFSEHSFGFRPGRSALQAVWSGPQAYVAAGRRWVVDI